MLYGFNVTQFSSYTRIHNQADKTPKKNYYLSCCVILYNPYIQLRSHHKYQNSIISCKQLNLRNCTISTDLW